MAEVVVKNHNTIKKYLRLVFITIIIAILFSVVWYLVSKPTVFGNDTVADGELIFSRTIAPKDTNALNRPLGVSVDRGGNIFVADSANNRIVKFDSIGTVEHMWDESDVNKELLSYPTAIAIDKRNNIYISDFANSRIQVIDEKGKYIRTLKNSNSNDVGIKGTALAFDNKNQIYVTDVIGQQVLVFSQGGKLIRSFGKGKLNFPNGIAIDNKNNEIYVADFNNSRIVVFNLEGNYKRIITQQDIGFENPRGLAYDERQNLLYITDIFNNRIIVVDKQNNITDIIDGSESGEKFSFPNSVCLDKQGSLFITDRENNRIVCYIIK